MMIVKFCDRANALTMTALMASISCALLAIRGRLGYAIVALILAGLCDLFDGLVARRLNRDATEKEFGARLDSLVDSCAFGFAPLVLFFCSGLNGLIHIPLLLCFCGGVVWRLAYFDVTGMEDVAARRYYTGLPSTYVALVIPLVYTVGLIQAAWLPTVLAWAIVLLTLAMISSVRIRKPSGGMYVVFFVLAVILTVTFGAGADRLASLDRVSP